MQALKINDHRVNLTNILIDLYKHGNIGSVLGFKGGTAAMLFHDLPRFSTDLDFDLISKYKRNSNKMLSFIDNVTKLLSARYEIQDKSTKYNTLFWLLSYGLGTTKIKIEISTRDIPYNHYEIMPFYGVNVKKLVISDMIAHKMVALLERKNIANRDIFDIHFFLGGPTANKINYDIIKHRTGNDPKAFFEILYDFINNISPKTVLNGLGEVLTDTQKDWAKVKLVSETLELIKRHIDLL